jgi:hypothetical protein
MKTSAVVDRFEEGYAILLFKDGDIKLVIPRKKLPKGTREGHWLLIEFEGEVSEDTIVNIAFDEEETRNARLRIMEKLERLRRGDHLGDE